MNANGQAAKTAAYALSRIDHWARVLVFVSVVCALFLAAIAGTMAGLAVEYYNAKHAIAETSRKMSEDMKTRFPVNMKGAR